MPRESVKSLLIKHLIDSTLFEIENIYEDNEDDELAEVLVDDEFTELYDNLSIVISVRRGIEYYVPKSTVWYDDVLSQFDDNRFRQMLRCSKDQFLFLASQISNSSEFHHKNSCKQLSVHRQLAIVLFRLGSSGESASIRKIATLFGIGDGGTIQKITLRVFRAFLKLQEKYIYWPDKAEREDIVNKTFHELPHCIGYVDGTEFKLSDTPIENPLVYFSRKHIYSIKAQITCDYNLRIRHVSIGSPGSVHDARIYSNCPLALNPSEYFNSNQWIAGDSAYSLSNTVITPYRTNATVMTQHKRSEFNLRHSKYRVRVEHCIGLLKERFNSLKELRHRISSKRNKKMCCLWILISCIIHNMLVNENDIEIFTSTDLVEDVPELPIEQAPQNDFDIKRQAIQKLIFG